MRILLTLITACLLGGGAMAQTNSFGLLKYNIPATWAEQMRVDLRVYAGAEPETGVWMEIRVHAPETAALKPDSSFRLAWKAHIANGSAAPVFKRAFTENGLPILYNAAYPAAVKENSTTLYKQLVVIIAGNQMQSIEMVAGSEKELKQLRNFIGEFIESADSIVKPKE